MWDLEGQYCILAFFFLFKFFYYIYFLILEKKS